MKACRLRIVGAVPPDACWCASVHDCWQRGGGRIPPIAQPGRGSRFWRVVWPLVAVVLVYALYRLVAQ